MLIRMFFQTAISLAVMAALLFVPAGTMAWPEAWILLIEIGGIGLQILGLGVNGHIGFNEPATALVARTHRTRLKRATRRANAALFDHRAGAVPTEALSMGMATILHARRIVLLATGAAKARCVKHMIEGPVTPRLPGSFVQLHRCAEIWLDRAAANRL